MPPSNVEQGGQKRKPPPLPSKQEVEAIRAGPSATVSGAINAVSAAIDTQRFSADFRKADVDSSGSLGREEVMKYLAAKGVTADEAYLDELMSVFDADGSGEIDAKEFTGLVRLMMSHERSVQKARMASSDNGEFEDNFEDARPLECCGQPCSPFCGLMVCGIVTVVFLMLLWPVSVTSCTDGQSTRAAADAGLPPPGDRRRAQEELLQGPVDDPNDAPPIAELPEADFIPVDASCSDPPRLPRIPYQESRCLDTTAAAGEESDFHCLNGGSCVDVPPSVCSGSGDPHYTSFDGKRFDFMGSGDFWLVNSERIKLQGRHVPCNGARPTCFVAFAVAVCDGSVTPTGSSPCSTPDEWVTAHRQEGQIDVQFPANCKATGGEASCKIHIASSGGSFRIKLPGMYFRQTTGLCGDFDTNVDNDGGFCSTRADCNRGPPAAPPAGEEFRVRDTESLFSSRFIPERDLNGDDPGSVNCAVGTDQNCYSASPATCQTTENVPGADADTVCAPYAAGWDTRTGLDALLVAEEAFVLNRVNDPHISTRVVLNCFCPEGGGQVCGHEKCADRVNPESDSYDSGCYIAVKLCEHGLTDINACVDDFCEGLLVAAEGVIEAAHEIAIEMGNEPDPIHYVANGNAGQGGWTESQLTNNPRIGTWQPGDDPCDPSTDGEQEASRNPCTRSKHGTCSPVLPQAAPPPPGQPPPELEIGPDYECLCDEHWHTGDPADGTRMCDTPGEHPNYFHMHEAHNYGCDCPAGYEGVACEQFLNPCEPDANLRGYLNGPQLQDSTICPASQPQCYAFGPPDGPVIAPPVPDDPTVYFTPAIGLDETTNQPIFPVSDPGYQCGCPRGMKGPDCNIVIEECCSNPCPEGNFCVEGPVGDGAFTCRPPAGLSASAEAISVFVENVACTPGVGSLSPLWSLLLGALLFCCCLHRKKSIANSQDDDIEEALPLGLEEKEEFTMWILFILDPSGVRHACEVMSTEWNIDTIYQKAFAATGIPVDEQVLTFGGRTLSPGKKLTSYGVQHGSEIVLKTKSGAAVQSRQGKVAAKRRDIKVTRGKQSI